MSLTRIFWVWLKPLSPDPNLVWTTPAQTLFHVIRSHPSTASLKGWAQSYRPHGHACRAKWIYHRRAQLVLLDALAQTSGRIHHAESKVGEACCRKILRICDDVSRIVANYILWRPHPAENKHRFRGRKRHINIWNINNFSVTSVTDPPGREPDSSRPGTRTKTLMFLGFRTQHINFWPLATGRETPPPPGRESAPRPGSHRKNLFMFMCLFLSWRLSRNFVAKCRKVLVTNAPGQFAPGLASLSGTWLSPNHLGNRCA